MRIQNEITKIFHSKQEMEKAFPDCNIYRYKRLVSGQVFRTQWLRFCFVAPRAGAIFQIATKENLFVKYVFVEG